MPLMHCVSNTAKTSVTSGVTWNSQSRALGPGDDQAVSSRPSDQRQRLFYTSDVKIRPVPNIRFEFEPDRIVGQMHYSYSTEYCHDLEPEYG